MERSQISECDEYKPRATQVRLQPIFDVIEAQARRFPNVFTDFCSRLRFLAKDEPYHHLILDWLDRLTQTELCETLTQEDIFAAKIFFDIYDLPWSTVGETLLELLDRDHLNIRACAAHQIAKFYSNFLKLENGYRYFSDREKNKYNSDFFSGLPPFEEMMDTMRRKEIERPGIAGAFWSIISWIDRNFEDYISNRLDPNEWLLDILENSPEPEPYLPYFPCNLAFDAHERFSDNANAIRRLINMGRLELALFAATDRNYKIPELQPLLVELGYANESEVVRLASWHLAYYYHYLHPEGAKQGYVELIGDLPEIDLFLLFPKREEPESPYAAIIYNKNIEEPLSQSLAKQWIDRIFPINFRGALRSDLPTGISNWYQKGYIDYHSNEKKRSRSFKKRESESIDTVIVGYRSNTPWNPKQFL
ncbi:hypothetical protein [Baaleninema simplex]|uniref:hypothetical protein n=1 Tax=Baaleninema simplex TaxID=2862350 RepID=UPI001181817B|nr:hypothetical protein [Baaleninema simplex]